MKSIISTLFLSLFLVLGFGQKRPDQFTEETSPTDANFEVYSQKNGQVRRASLANLKKYFTPDLQATPIGYVPTLTGNTLNLMEFVEDTNGDKWYIDSEGKGIKLYNASQGIEILLVADTTGALVSGVEFYKDTLATPDSLYWHDGGKFKYIGEGGSFIPDGVTILANGSADTTNYIATKSDLLNKIDKNTITRTFYNIDSTYVFTVNDNYENDVLISVDTILSQCDGCDVGQVIQYNYTLDTTLINDTLFFKQKIFNSGILIDSIITFDTNTEHLTISSMIVTPSGIPDTIKYQDEIGGIVSHPVLGVGDGGTGTDDHDFYTFSTTDNPTTISDNVYRSGKMAIGDNSGSGQLTIIAATGVIDAMAIRSSTNDNTTNIVSFYDSGNAQVGSIRGDGSLNLNSNTDLAIPLQLIQDGRTLRIQESTFNQGMVIGDGGENLVFATRVSGATEFSNTGAVIFMQNANESIGLNHWDQGQITSEAAVHIRGKGNDNTTYSLSCDNNANTRSFGIKDDGTVDTYGFIKINTTFPVLGTGVDNGSIFKGVDGNLYYKTDAGVVSQIN